MISIPRTFGLLFASVTLITACAGDPGHFEGQKGPQRKSSGNAPLEGPGAREVIRDVHRDRARQNYEDRSQRRYYGNY